jgi:hypothetical protein
MGNEGRLLERPQGPKDIQTHSGETEDHTKEKVTIIPDITIEDPELGMPSQDMKMPP